MKLDPPLSTGINILIVDDDPDTCMLLALLFRSKGYNPTVAYSGKDAIEKVTYQPPDVIVLDVAMPDMDGWETIENINKFSDVPVLFLSALDDSKYASRALRMGAEDYVRKPYSQDELLERVRLLVKRRLSSRPRGGTFVRTREEANRPTVSLVIPTLNEAENLPLVLPYIPMDWVDEVVLVDGRSTDATVEVAQKILPSIKVVLEHRKGKGAAMRAGYKAAKGDVIVIMDADGSNDPREIPKFIQALIEGCDFAKGSRFAPGGGTTDMPRFRQLGNQFFVTLVNLLFNTHFTDLCYGFHAFWRFCLDALDLDGIDGFEIDTALYIRSLRHRLKIVEVPSFEGYRFYGQSKLRTIPDGWRVLKTIAKEKYSDLRDPQQDLYLGFRGEPKSGLPFESSKLKAFISIQEKFVER